jgi:hypothetical protein
MSATTNDPSRRYADAPIPENGTYAGATDNSQSDLYEDRPSVLSEALATLDISGRMNRNPYQTLLIAAGVGYILGGGLFTRLTANVVRMGMRVGALPAVQRQLMGVAEAALSRRSNDSS